MEVAFTPSFLANMVRNLVRCKLVEVYSVTELRSQGSRDANLKLPVSKNFINAL